MTRTFPSAMRNEQASGSAPVIRKQPTAAQVAMMPSDQLKSYYQRRGQWGMSEEAKESLARFRRRGDSPW